MSLLSEDLIYWRNDARVSRLFYGARSFLQGKYVRPKEDTYKFLETNIFIPRRGNNLAISVCVRGKTGNFYGCVKIYSNRLCAELRAIMVCHLFPPKSAPHAGTYPPCRWHRRRRARVNAVDLQKSDSEKSQLRWFIGDDCSFRDCRDQASLEAREVNDPSSSSWTSIDRGV